MFRVGLWSTSHIKWIYKEVINVLNYHSWRNMEKSHGNNKFKISGTTWDKEVELPDVSHSVSDIQDYFEHILKKHKHWLINLQFKYIPTKFRTELHSKLGQDTILSFWHPKLWSYVEVLKEGQTKKKWWKCATTRN